MCACVCVWCWRVCGDVEGIHNWYLVSSQSIVADNPQCFHPNSARPHRQKPTGDRVERHDRDWSAGVCVCGDVCIIVAVVFLVMEPLRCSQIAGAGAGCAIAALANGRWGTSCRDGTGTGLACAAVGVGVRHSRAQALLRGDITNRGEEKKVDGRNGSVLVRLCDGRLNSPSPRCPDQPVRVRVRDRFRNWSSNCGCACVCPVNLCFGVNPRTSNIQHHSLCGLAVCANGVLLQRTRLILRAARILCLRSS